MTVIRHFTASGGIRAVGFATAAWAVGFAAVSGWQLAVGRPGDDPFADYASGIAAMSVLVLVLKLIAAALAMAAVSNRQPLVRPWALATALWSAFALLVLYSVGNLIITGGTLSGAVEPSEAWTAAGGVTPRAVLYLVFFLAGAVMFGALALSFQRRHQLGWVPVVVGTVGGPLMLGLILGLAPAILGWLGYLPS